MNQRDLVERAARADHDAFAVLVRASIGHLTAVARFIVRDEESARDAVQEAYIRAWRDLRGLRDPDRFDAWLHRLTVNASLDAVRRRRRHPVEIDIAPLALFGGTDHVGHVANRDLLERGFARIPPDQRAVLVLHYYIGLSVPSVADTLGIPLGTAQSRLGRALATLRGALGSDEERAVPATEGRTA